MITSVYFTNQAKRDQMEGRINRISQKSEFIDIYTVHVGLLSIIQERYKDAANLNQALKKLADEVVLEEQALKFL